MRVLEGKSVFSGIAIGKISILQKADTSVKRTKVENPEAEITRVQEAKEKAVEQLQKLYDKAALQLQTDYRNHIHSGLYNYLP